MQTPDDLSGIASNMPAYGEWGLTETPSLSNISCQAMSFPLTYAHTNRCNSGSRSFFRAQQPLRRKAIIVLTDDQ